MCGGGWWVVGYTLVEVLSCVKVLTADRASRGGWWQKRVEVWEIRLRLE